MRGNNAETGSTFCPGSSDCSAKSMNRASATGVCIPSMRQILTAVSGRTGAHERGDDANVLGGRIEHGIQLVLCAFGLALGELPRLLLHDESIEPGDRRPDLFERS